MRIGSLHTKYLDAKGLVAGWWEALLAKHVLERKTKGYKNHPQLIRFKNSRKPVGNINFYLSVLYNESMQRQYVFDKSKVNWRCSNGELTVTDGQLAYEFKHLLTKLKARDPTRYKLLKKTAAIEPHPLLRLLAGR